MQYDMFTMQHNLSINLTEKRFYHSLGVQTTSFAMAVRFQCDLDKASVAGLIHDCAKCLSDEQLLLYCQEYNLTISDIEKRNPFLLHGKLGAYFAENKYGVKDADILSAITYHTTGKPEMSMLEKIIFIADFIEPSRSPDKIPNLNRIRKIAFQDLDEAVYQILGNTLHYLAGVEHEIDNLTVEAYEYYKALKNRFKKGDYNEEHIKRYC